MSTILSRKVSVSVNGNKILQNASVETPLDLKALIVRIAQQNGVGRFDVYINGSRVSPNEIDKVFSQNTRLDVNIVPADIAASTWATERICDPTEFMDKIPKTMFFLRQKSLPLNHYESVAVAGLGGIGSWIAFFLALSRLVDKLELIDFDYVESHNLNRTPFKLDHLCLLKTMAIQELIKQTNMNIKLELYHMPLEKVIDKLESNVLIESTDSLKIRPLLEKWLEQGRKLITVHYDGESITIGVNLIPGEWTTTSETSGYSTAPVYVATPALAAALAVHILLWGENEGFFNERFLFKSTLSDIVNIFSLR